MTRADARRDETAAPSCCSLVSIVALVCLEVAAASDRWRRTWATTPASKSIEVVSFALQKLSFNFLLDSYS